VNGHGRICPEDQTQQCKLQADSLLLDLSKHRNRKFNDWRKNLKKSVQRIIGYVLSQQSVYKTKVTTNARIVCERISFWLTDRKKRILDWWEPFLFRLSLALDDFIQAWFREGVIGVTISSRTGTAKDHGHKWGEYGERFLNHCWPFNLDFKTSDGKISHCDGAITNDCLRSVNVIRSLLGDPVVVKARGLQRFKLEILEQVRQICEEKVE
jgi:hypothetical protein